MIADGATPVSVGFPLRGEWVAINSPGDRVPSHGTDTLAQRYAYDFVRVDRRPGWHPHPAGSWRTNLLGVPLRECYGWGQPVHMPFDGEIIRAEDGVAERERLVPLAALARVLRTALTFDLKNGFGPVAGNHVIVRAGDIHAAFAHLTTGSVTVTAGQRVRAGEIVGRVGHTGNSTMPHLHFQLMDGPDPVTAKGLPCAFHELEIERDGGWDVIRDAVPRRTDRIRFGAHDAPPGTDLSATGSAG